MHHGVDGSPSVSTAAGGGWKPVIGDGLRFRADERRGTEIAITVRILNHTLDPGCPDSVRIA